MMKTFIKLFSLFIAASLLITACNHQHDEAHEHGTDAHADHGSNETEAHQDKVHLSHQQFDALGVAIDTIPLRSMGKYVEANGALEVPPQNEATVTAIIGANVSSITIIEGDKVKKGEPLAYLSHPDLIELQTRYSTNWNELQYLRQEHERQKKLYEQQVGSGKEYQKIQAEYGAKNALVNGLGVQLKLMGLNLEKIQGGFIYEQVAVVSPIEGYVRLVEIKTGQFVRAETEMFEIVNIDHIHADLMVFEKDMHLVKKNQKVRLFIESMPNAELEATIYAVGKAFEMEPKAIHLHAEIENKTGLLIPGMYVRGQIQLEETQVFALPDASVVQDGEQYFIFTATEIADGNTTEWEFTPIEIRIGVKDNGWVEVKLLKPLAPNAVVAWNSAYYLLAEMKKGEAEHTH